MKGGRTLFGVAAALTGLLLSLCAAGAAGAFSPTPIATVIDLPHDCEMRFAPRLSPKAIPKLARQMGNAWSGCVKVRGLAVNGQLFADPDAYYRTGGDSWDAPAFYTDNPKLIADGSDRARWVEVSGFIAECDSLYFSRDYEQSWKSPDDGPCAKRGGMIMLVKEAQIGEPFLLTRRTSDRDRQRLGDLALVPAFDIAPPRVQALANDWLAAVRTGDREAYGRLMPDAAHDHDTEQALFEDARLDWLRKLPADRPIQLLVQNDRWYPNWQPTTYLGCVCRDDDCAGRWPINVYDAGLNPSRPYACVSILRDRYDRNGAWFAISGYDPRTLREPARRR